jgi:hypothetical protein
MGGRRPRGPRRRAGGERGAAVVDFVLVLVILVPLVLGVMQVGLVLHVRNTLASAAAEGARVVAAQDGTAAQGVAYARSLIDGAISGEFAGDIDVRQVVIGGRPSIEVVIEADVPALGLGGPSVHVEVSGHAVKEPA